MRITSVMAVGAGVLAVAAGAWGDFVDPSGYGWSRGDAGSAYFEWDVFVSTGGGNAPDVGQFPDPLPGGWVSPDVVETSGLGIVTATGNLYSPSGPIAIEATVPNYGQGAGFATTVLVQVRTQGTELDPASVRLDGAAPVETVELDRVSTGMGVQVDTLFRFEVDGNASVYVFELAAQEAHMSLDRLALDTLAAGSCAADFDGDGMLSVADFTAFRAAFLAGDMGADFDGDGMLNVADFVAFRAAFLAGCP